MTRNGLAQRAARHGFAVLILASAITPAHAEETGVIEAVKQMFDDLTSRPESDGENTAFAAEAEAVRQDRRADLSDIARLAGADPTCEGKLVHEMEAPCWDTIERHLDEVRHELDQLKRDIDRERGQ